MSQRFVGGTPSKDLYKLLQIEQGSTIQEIKVAYKKLALQIHPDRNNGCAAKTQQFKDLTEAYSVLSNDASRRQYDLAHGFRYNQNRRTAPPKNYRKVYRPVMPKGMNYDHVRHYEMHYGKGMRDEAFRQAKRDQPTGYQSPLGKGFSFAGGINNSTNPFATKAGKARQTTDTVWEYEEGTMGFDTDDRDDGRKTIRRRDTIVQDIHGRRRERKQEEAAAKAREEERKRSAFQPEEESCVIQ